MPYDHKVREFGAQAEIEWVIEPEMLDKASSVVSVLEGALEDRSEPAHPMPPASWDRLQLTPIDLKI